MSISVSEGGSFREATGLWAAHNGQWVSVPLGGGNSPDMTKDSWSMGDYAGEPIVSDDPLLALSWEGTDLVCTVTSQIPANTFRNVDTAFPVTPALPTIVGDYTQASGHYASSRSSTTCVLDGYSRISGYLYWWDGSSMVAGSQVFAIGQDTTTYPNYYSFDTWYYPPMSPYAGQYLVSLHFRASKYGYIAPGEVRLNMADFKFKFANLP